MLKIAITGNMGSGKSTVCKVFDLLGVPVFYADLEAKGAYYDPETLEKIKHILGNDIFDSNGGINKKQIATIVFTNRKMLEELNSVIHPYVQKKYAEWVLQHGQFPYCIHEAALTFETGAYKKFDYTILVYAPENDLIKRTIIRDKLQKHEVKQRLRFQMSQEKKKELADYVIFNDNSELIIPAILEMHNFFSHNSNNPLEKSS